MARVRPQRTLKSEVSYSGIGLHTGKEVTIRFLPAPAHSGVVFQRVDMVGKPTIPATVEYVRDTARSTTLGVGSCFVQTVEHVLAALFSHGIDNLCIQVSEGEPPVGDGSSHFFVKMIEEAGIEEQKELTTIAELLEPVYHTDREISLIALPSDEFRISYMLHYPQAPPIRSQYFSTAIDAETFKRELAPSRTFALYEEINILMEQGLIRGGNLENAIVVKGEAVISHGGLRYPNDEMVRHKILDLVGDLSLVGFHFCAHIIAIRSGHSSNVAMAQKLYEKMFRKQFRDRFAPV